MKMHTCATPGSSTYEFALLVYRFSCLCSTCMCMGSIPWSDVCVFQVGGAGLAVQDKAEAGPLFGAEVGLPRLLTTHMTKDGK